MAQLVLGTMNCGANTTLSEGMFAEANKLVAQPAVDELLSTFVSLGGTEIDAARVYMGGNTEVLLGASAALPSLSVATKSFPSSLLGKMKPQMVDFMGGNTQQLHDSLTNLKRDCADIWYLHLPDEEAPLEDILAEADTMHKAGKYRELGLSNFNAWQVMAA